MFDIDSLDAFIKPQEQQPFRPPDRVIDKEAVAPRSREERLRDFYSQREKQVAEEVGKSEKQLTPVDESLVQQNEKAAVEAAQRRKQGNDRYEAKDFEGAVEQYTLAIKAAPSSVLHANRAAAYMMLGWWDQALRDTKAAIRRDPQNVKALERHARVLLALDNLDGALEAVAELENRQAEEGQSALPSASASKLKWLIQAARNPTTLDECKAVLDRFNGKGELVSPLGIRLRKKVAKALVDRADALNNPRRIRPALQANRRTEDDVDEIQEITPFAEEAIRITAELLADNPEDADARYWRGRALVRLGRHADAEQQLLKSLELQPDHKEAHELLETMNSLEAIKARGNAYFKQGNYAEAIHLYTVGIEKDSACTDTMGVATMYYNRSAAYRKKGEFAKALEDANLALALHPKWNKALYRRGMLLMEVGRYSEALTELKVVQRADPTFDDELDNWLRRAHNWLAKSSDEPNYYHIMELPMDASKEDLKKQYRRLCLLWHPDKSQGSDESRQRFDSLQKAYKYLIDDERRDEYDFGIWKDRPVNHHLKKREKVKDTYAQNDEDLEPDAPQNHYNWGDRRLIEDDKVESIYWGEEGAPGWLQQKRKEYKRRTFGEEPLTP